MRYFLRLSYDGTLYHGWQKQPTAETVQETIEKAINLQWQPSERLEIVGCGRTDAGVHAENYIAHFDYDKSIDSQMINKLNRFLPLDIVVHDALPVHSDAHARFDAISRSYTYKLHTDKQVFNRKFSTYYPYLNEADVGKFNQVTELLKSYTEFKPFSKTRTDVKTYKCNIRNIKWTWDESRNNFTFDISANRFLRGMIRLIVGASVKITQGKMSISDLKHALDNQIPLNKPLSMPANGLILRDIQYPDEIFLKR